MDDKLDFACYELRLSKKELLSVKDKRLRKTKEIVNKRWILFLFFKMFEFPIAKIARITHFDRSSIYNCFHHYSEAQYIAADQLHALYIGENRHIQPKPIYEYRYIPDYLHSKVEFLPVQINQGDIL